GRLWSFHSSWPPWPLGLPGSLLGPLTFASSPGRCTERWRPAIPIDDVQPYRWRPRPFRGMASTSSRARFAGGIRALAIGISAGWMRDPRICGPFDAWLDDALTWPLRRAYSLPI